MIKLSSLLLTVPLAALLSLSAGVQSHATAEEGEKELRICASTNEAPFSTEGGKGFENRIATVLAEAMGRKTAFVWADKPAIYLVRDYLDKTQCDVVIGLDSGDERVLTSKPYYRTGYVFVTLAERQITAADWSDPQIAGLSRFAIRFYSPPADLILRDLGKYEDNVAYLHSLVGFKSRRNQYAQVSGETSLSPLRLMSRATSSPRPGRCA
jgi:mxaJ protein